MAASGGHSLDLKLVVAAGPGGLPSGGGVDGGGSVAAGSSSNATTEADVNAVVATANGAGGACTSVVACARPSAGKSGGRPDVFGLLGFVCGHVIALRGGFVDLYTHEAFGYYIILLTQLLPLLRKVEDIYVDFGCKLQATWQAYYALHRVKPELCAEKYPHLDAVRILVNWMHGAGHVLACQLVHSGRFKEGAARRIGEMTEQLWALFKVCASAHLLFIVATHRVCIHELTCCRFEVTNVLPRD